MGTTNCWRSTGDPRRAVLVALAALAVVPTSASGAVSIGIAPPVLGPIGGDWTDHDANAAISPGDDVYYYVSLMSDGPTDPEAVSGMVVNGRPLACPPAIGIGRTACGAHVHTYTAADVRAGRIVIDASVVVAGTPVPVTVRRITPLDVDVRLDARAPATEDRDANGYLNAGDAIHFGFDVANDSPVVAVRVPAVEHSLAPGARLACVTPLLRPGDAGACDPFVHVITAADVARGQVTSVASADVHLPGPGSAGGELLGTRTATATVPLAAGVVEQVAGAVVDVDGNGIDPGDTIAYRIDVENRGREQLTATEAHVPLAPGGVVACAAPTPLAPAERRECGRFVHTLTAGDIAAGQVTSDARVRFRLGAIPGPEAVHRLATPLGSTPAASLDVRLAVRDLDGDDDDAGDAVGAAVTVRNTGAVALDVVEVDAPRLGRVDCPPPPGGLPPGATLSCAVSGGTLGQSDLDDGVLTVPATLAVGAGATRRTVRTTTTLRLATRTDLRLGMVAGDVADSDGNGHDAGDTITYAITLENRGNVTLTGVHVGGPRVGPVACPLPAPGLAPGAALRCAPVTYRLTLADLDARSVVSLVTATVNAPGRAPQAAASATARTASHRTVLVAAPRVRLSRSISRVAVGRGERVRGLITVRNAGTASVFDVQVCDESLAGLTSTSDDATASGGRICWTLDLAPGATRRLRFRSEVSRTARPGTRIGRTTAELEGARLATTRRALLVLAGRRSAAPVVTG